MSEYIKRVDTIKRLEELTYMRLPFIEAVIKTVPAADVVERKTGQWIWGDEGYHCSECFFHAYGNTLECMDGTFAYCPNCGADMRQLPKGV